MNWLTSKLKQYRDREELKDQLYKEYNLLNKATKQLLPNQKQILVGMTMGADWAIFLQMLDNWKYLIVQKGLTYGKSEQDLVSIRSQIKTIAVLKTFQNKYKADYVPPTENTESDTATTIEL